MSKRYTETEILSTWAHVVPDSLAFEAEGLHANKQTVEIRTRDVHGEFDGQTRRIATSDLFQCFWTRSTKDALDKLRRSAKRRMGTTSRDAAVEAMKGLDSMWKAQVALCKVEHPRIEEARRQLAAESESLAKPVKAAPVKVTAKANKGKAKDAATALGVA